MEVAVVDTVNLPEGHIVSIRLGDTRRQAPLEKLRRHSLKFPATIEACTEPLKLEVLQVLASTRLVLRPGEASYQLGLGTNISEGRLTTLGLRVQNASASSSGAADTAPCSARTSRPTSALAVSGLPKYQDAAAAARDYLEHHGLLRYIQALLHAVIQDRPDDPYDYLIEQLSAAVKSTSSSTQDTDAISRTARTLVNDAVVSSAPPDTAEAPKRPSGSAGLAAVAAASAARREQELEELVASLKAEVEQLSGSLREAQATQAQFRSDLESAQQQKDSLQKDNDVLKAGAAQLAELDDVRSQNSSLRQENDVLKAQVKERAEFEAVQQQNAALRGTVDMLKAQSEIDKFAAVDVMQQQNVALREENTALTSRIEELLNARERETAKLADAVSHPGDAVPQPPATAPQPPPEPPSMDGPSSPPPPESEPPPLPALQAELREPTVEHSSADATEAEVEEARRWAQTTLLEACETGELVRALSASRHIPAPPPTKSDETNGPTDEAAQVDASDEQADANWFGAGLGRKLGGTANNRPLSPVEKRQKALEAAEGRRRCFGRGEEEKQTACAQAPAAPAVDDLRGRLRDSLATSFESGRLAEALENVMKVAPSAAPPEGQQDSKAQGEAKPHAAKDGPPCSAQPVPDALAALASASASGALASIAGLSPPSNQPGDGPNGVERSISEQVKVHVKQRLRTASFSDDFAIALGLEPPPPSNRPSKQPPSHGDAANSTDAARAEADHSSASKATVAQSVEETAVVGSGRTADESGADDLRARLAHRLFAACESGELQNALGMIGGTQSTDETADLKARLQRTLTEATQSGTLSKALSDLMAEDVDVQKLKLRLRETLKQSCESGILSRALSEVLPQPSAQEEIRRRLQEAATESGDSGSIRTAPFSDAAENLKQQLRGHLLQACESGDLARVLNEVNPSFSSNSCNPAEALPPPERAAPESCTPVPGIAVGQSSDVPQSSSAKVDREALEQVKTQVRAALTTSWETGQLHDALKEVTAEMNLDTQDVEALKNLLKHKLVTACSSGDLEAALQRVVHSSEKPLDEKTDVAAPKASESSVTDKNTCSVEEMRRRLMTTLRQASESGALAEKLDEFKRAQKPGQSSEVPTTKSQVQERQSSEGTDAQEPLIEEMKARVRDALQSSCNSGDLERALRKVQPGEPRVDDLRRRLSETLAISCVSGSLAEALSKVRPEPHTQPRSEGEGTATAPPPSAELGSAAEVQDAQKVQGADEGRAEQEAQDPAKAKLQDVKTQLRGLLYDGYKSGTLKQALHRLNTQESNLVEEQKARVKEALRRGCETGELGHALEAVMMQSHVPAGGHLREHMKSTLETALASGDLDRALDSLHRRANYPAGSAEPMADLKKQLQNTLLESCQSGNLENELKQVLDSRSQPAEDGADVNAAVTTAEQTVEAPAEKCAAQESTQAEQKIEGLKERLRQNLQEAHQSGDLEKALQSTSAKAEAPAVFDTSGTTVTPSSPTKAVDLPEGLVEEIRDIRSEMSQLGKENVSLKTALQQMCEEMAAVRQQNALLAEKLAAHYEEHGSGHGH